MSQNKEIDPAKALDRFFSIVREEAISNPRFGTRLIEAVGYTVVFRGSESLPALDPVLVATKGQEEFRNTFLSFKAAELKKIIKDFNLATTADLAGKSKPSQLVDVMWIGASAKIRDRGMK